MVAADTQHQYALEIVRTLRNAGYEALWAGGCVRDQLLGKTPEDFDVATSARPEEVQEVFGRKRTLEIGASFGVISVLGGRHRDPIEVATFRSDGAYVDGRHPEAVVFTTAEQDAQRRDFTINGLFFDPLEEKVIDYVEGQRDLRQGIIRAIGDPQARFVEDKLRMLRAVRFATTLEFVVDQTTLAAIQAMASEIRVVSAERIGTEFRKILLHPQRSAGLALMHQVGLWQAITRLFNPSDPNSSEPGDEKLSAQPAFQQRLELLAQLSSPSLPLTLAALLTGDTDGLTGSGVARALRFTKKEGLRTDWLLAHIESLAGADKADWPTIQRLLIHPGREELLDLHEARLGSFDPGLKFCREKISQPDAVLNPQPLLSGDDLLAHGLQPSPHFAALLELVRDAQLEGEIATQAEALQLVDQWVREQEEK